jgi:hypothetical protein
MALVTSIIIMLLQNIGTCIEYKSEEMTILHCTILNYTILFYTVMYYAIIPLEHPCPEESNCLALRVEDRIMNTIFLCYTVTPAPIGPADIPACGFATRLGNVHITYNA